MVLRQSFSFVVVGLVQLAIDVSLFLGFVTLGLNMPLANIFSRGSAALTGFYLNGKVTFSSQIGGTSVKDFFWRFFALWIFLTGLSTVLVSAVEMIGNFQLFKLGLAKFIIEAGLVVLSFMGQKLWVYK